MQDRPTPRMTDAWRTGALMPIRAGIAVAAFMAILLLGIHAGAIAVGPTVSEDRPRSGR